MKARLVIEICEDDSYNHVSIQIILFLPFLYQEGGWGYTACTVWCVLLMEALGPFVFHREKQFLLVFFLTFIK